MKISFTHIALIAPTIICLNRLLKGDLVYQSMDVPVFLDTGHQTVLHTWLFWFKIPLIANGKCLLHFNPETSQYYHFNGNPICKILY